MNRILLFVLSAVSLGLPVVRANTVFLASGVFQSGAVMSGTITLDTVTGQTVSADVFLTAPDTNQFLFIQSQSLPGPGVTLLQLSPVVMGFPHLLLAFPVADFTGYMGGVICAPGGPCGGVSNLTDGVHFDTLASGTLTPAAAPAGGLSGMGSGHRRCGLSRCPDPGFATDSCREVTGT